MSATWQTLIGETYLEYMAMGGDPNAEIVIHPDSYVCVSDAIWESTILPIVLSYQVFYGVFVIAKRGTYSNHHRP